MYIFKYILSSDSIDRILVSSSNLKHSCILTSSIVKTSQSTMLRLLCYKRNDNHRNIYVVKIDGARCVQDLKEAIKEEARPCLDDIPTLSLLLWKASVEISQNLKEDVEELNLGQSLEQSEILSNISWSGLGEKRIHVIID